MSYCRWSSDDFRCDLYVYGASDGVVIHVASMRYDVPVADYPPPMELDADNIEAWMVRHRTVMALIAAAPKVAIGLPYDGESYYGLTEHEAAEKVRELIRVGYRCDPSVADDLEAEAPAGTPTQEGRE